MLRTIYEKVNLAIPLEERRFFNYIEDTTRELMSMYGKFVLEEGIKEFTPPETMADEFPIRPLYTPAYVDNIVYLATGNETMKSEFLRKSRDAYHKYWSDNAKGKQMIPKRWWR